MNIYLQCFLIAVLGAALKIWKKFINARNDAGKFNIEFNASVWARMDWPTWPGSLIAIGICMFLVDVLLAYKPWMAIAIKPIFVTVGWTGADLVISLLGTSSTWIKHIADVKTTIGDKARGTLNRPTPLPQTTEDKQRILTMIEQAKIDPDA